MATVQLRVIDRDGMDDKNKALEAALGQIERAFGKGAIMRLGANQPVPNGGATLELL